MALLKFRAPNLYRSTMNWYFIAMLFGWLWTRKWRRPFIEKTPLLSIQISFKTDHGVMRVALSFFVTRYWIVQACFGPKQTACLVFEKPLCSYLICLSCTASVGITKPRHHFHYVLACKRCRLNVYKFGFEFGNGRKIITFACIVGSKET